MTKTFLAFNLTSNLIAVILVGPVWGIINLGIAGFIIGYYVAEQLNKRDDKQ